MEIGEWKKKIASAKPSPKMANLPDLKLTVSPSRTIQILARTDKCKHCGNESKKRLTISFIKPHKITVFEAGLLWMLFVENKKPVDYAGFHKCTAGKEFIKNIGSIDGE